MIRHWFSVIALACLVVAPVQAGELHPGSGIFLSPSNLKTTLVRSDLRAGGVSLEIFAAGQVDVARLLAGVDLAKSASAQTISAQVNEERKRLYPDEEIILIVTPARSRAAAADEKAALVKALYWWNNTNCSECSWYAQYKSTVATMFIDDIEYGAYDIYDRTGNGRWIYRYDVFAGEAASGYSVGARTNRGFMGTAAGVPSRADVVLYFFK